MDCTDWVELISVAADGELDDAERLLLDTHLEVCAGCRVRVAEVEAVRRRTLLGLAEPARQAGPTPDLVAWVLEARAAEVAARRALRRRVLAVTGAAAAVLAVLASPAVRDGADPIDVVAVVHVDAGGFTAPSVTVPTGATVAWHNHSGTDHHLVHETTGEAVGTDLGSGEAETATFAVPGTYRYFCTRHEGMAGHVVVHA